MGRHFDGIDIVFIFLISLYLVILFVIILWIILDKLEKQVMFKKRKTISNAKLKNDNKTIYVSKDKEDKPKTVKNGLSTSSSSNKKKSNNIVKKKTNNIKTDKQITQKFKNENKSKKSTLNKKINTTNKKGVPSKTNNNIKKNNSLNRNNGYISPTKRKKNSKKKK